MVLNIRDLAAPSYLSKIGMMTDMAFNEISIEPTQGDNGNS